MKAISLSARVLLVIFIQFKFLTMQINSMIPGRIQKALTVPTEARRSAVTRFRADARRYWGMRSDRVGVSRLKCGGRQPHRSLLACWMSLPMRLNLSLRKINGLQRRPEAALAVRKGCRAMGDSNITRIRSHLFIYICSGLTICNSIWQNT